MEDSAQLSSLFISSSNYLTPCSRISINFFPEWKCYVHPVIRMHWVLLIHEEKCSFPSRGKKCADPGCENFCQSFFCNRMMHRPANCFQMICTLVDCSNCRPSLKSQISDFWLKACEYVGSEATNSGAAGRERREMPLRSPFDKLHIPPSHQPSCCLCTCCTAPLPTAS